MTTRTSTETVTFQHPFRLSRIDEVQPAGHYIIETEEELLEALSFPAYRRHVTSIHLAGRPHSSELSRVLDIDPAELSAALATDARTREIPPALIKRTTSEVGKKTRCGGICQRGETVVGAQRHRGEIERFGCWRRGIDEVVDLTRPATAFNPLSFPPISRVVLDQS